jgi:hypothetical protein
MNVVFLGVAGVLARGVPAGGRHETDPAEGEADRLRSEVDRGLRTGTVKLIGAAEVPAAVVVWGRFGPYAFGA